ncbi:MAG: tetrathionate reductase family octaheme c-type cytochrome [bacterium]
MNRKKKIAAIALACALIAAVAAAWVTHRGGVATPPGDAYEWSKVPKKLSPTNHAALVRGPLKSGPAVTRECIRCHPEEANDFMKTAHWNWVGDETFIPGHDTRERIGKKNLINNFCISVESNWPKCTTCHAGYGWKNDKFDFKKKENIDCLVCHDHSGGYAKDDSGLPAKGVDLLAAAQSVGRPTRSNCGACHFNGGGGNAVKHGDLDGSLNKPVERVDVHMGRLDLQCVDCHKTKKHRIPGRSMSVSVSGMGKMDCSDCHTKKPHESERLNEHVAAVACQACHIPFMAVKEPTKIAWDWSTAGKDVPVDDPHEYLKIKGSFVYEKNIAPTYMWFNGRSGRYLKGDKIDPNKITNINYPLGRISDPGSRIWPFKVHYAKQPYDVGYNYLLIPQTVGKGGYWTDFNWNQAATLAQKFTGLKFSGKMGFTKTGMYWPLSHMVSPKGKALQCTDCHGDNGRLAWRALGYSGDPAKSGGRERMRLLISDEVKSK